MLYFLVMSSKTAFFRFKDIYPECYVLQEKYPLLKPLICLQEDNSCHVGLQCMDKLTSRIHKLFDQVVPSVSLIILYYQKKPFGMEAGVFWRDFREPQVVPMNQWAWEAIKKRGEVFEYSPDYSFFLNNSASVPNEELAKKLVGT